MISLDEIYEAEDEKKKKELLPKPVRPQPNVTVPTEEVAPPPPQVSEDGWGEHGDLFEMSDAAKTAEKQERSSGPVTQVGRALNYVAGTDPGIVADALNTAAAIPKVLTQGLDKDNVIRRGAEALDRTILGAQETREGLKRAANYQDAKRAAGQMGAIEATLDTTANVLEGVAHGTAGGIALPFTVAARLSDQATPWADPPETLKNSPLGKLAFEITQIVVPTLLTGGVAAKPLLAAKGISLTTAAGKATLAGLALESGIETATQDSMEDLILGRRLASYYGDVWASLSGSKEAGAQLTVDLIEGKTIPAKAMIAISGFFMNLGINKGAEDLFFEVFKRIKPQKQLTGTRGNYLAPGREALPPSYYTTDPNAEFFTGDKLGEWAEYGDTRIVEQAFPNGAELEWSFFKADSPDAGSLDGIAGKQFNWEPLIDISRRKVEVQWRPLNSIKLGNRGIRLRSFFRDFLRKNLEPGDIVMNAPTPDAADDFRMSRVQRTNQRIADEQISARQVQAIEDNIDKEEVWQYFGDLGVDANYNQLSDAEVALKYLSEDEYRIWNQSPRIQRMKPGLDGRINHLTKVARKRAGADLQGFVNTKEGVKKWWDGLDDAEKALEAQTAIENEIIKEPPYDDLNPNVRARIYEGWGFSKPNNQEYELAKGYQFGVLRKFPTSDGPSGRLVDPLHIEFDGKEIKNLTEVRAQIESAIRATPPQRRPVTDLDKKVSLVVKRKVDDIIDEVSDVHRPTYNVDAEPHESVNIDTDVPVARGTDKNPYINDSALMREAMKEKGIGEDGLTIANRDFYTNWKALTSVESIEEALRLSTSRLRNIEAFPKDLKRLELRAQQWIQNNVGLIDGNIDQALENFKAYLTPVNPRKESMVSLSEKFDTKTILAEKTATQGAGYLVAAMMGEELGLRLHKLATAATNLEIAGIDFTKTIENLIELQDKTNLFLIPLRRGKRKWAVEGVVQQRKTIERLKDPDYLAALAKDTGGQQSIEAPSTAFTKIQLDEADPGATLRELWEAYKGGNGEAGRTLKAYVAAIQSVDPIAAVDQVTNLSSVLFEQLKKGQPEAIRQLFYGGLLGRIGTLAASTSSGIAQLVAQPLGLIGSPVFTGTGLKQFFAKKGGGNLADVMEGFGQLAGGLTQIQDAVAIGIRSWRANQTLIGGSKISQGAGNLKVKQEQLEQLFKGAKKEVLQKYGEDSNEMFQLGVLFNTQSWANHPWVHLGMRSLTALDDAIKSIHGSQVATGRAFREAAESGDVVAGLLNIKEGVNNNLAKVFENGARDGVIIDPDVLAAAKEITFQTPIPRGTKNPFTNAFRAVQNASDNSALFKFFTPFVRVSYKALDSAARYTLAGTPGYNQLINKLGIGENLGVNTYQEILTGKHGAVAQQQLKSQIAFGRMYMMSVAAYAIFGRATGSNSGDMPRNSLIIPSPATPTGWIAIPYGRIEPFGSIMSVIVDTVNAYREGVIGEGNYQRATSEILYSLSMATFDKSFMSGQQRFAELMNFKNWDKDGHFSKSLGQTAANVIPSSQLRMLGNWVQPYKTVNKEARFWNNFISTLRHRVLGGAGNPLMYDIYTGKKIPKVTSIANNDNYWFTVGGSIMNEFTFPGQIQNIKQDFVAKTLYKLGYKVNPRYLMTLEGSNLTLDEQSALSKNIAPIGRLNERLEAYFKSDKFKLAYARLQAARKDENKKPIDRTFLLPNDSGQGTAANKFREQIFEQISKIHREAKETAAAVTLNNDANFILKRNSIKPEDLLLPAR